MNDTSPNAVSSPSGTESATRVSTSPAGSRRPLPVQREFQRAFKACITCRKRKSRCEVSAEDYAAGRPCVRCRREMKECLFPVERRTAKRRKTSETREPEDAPVTYGLQANEQRSDPGNAYGDSTWQRAEENSQALQTDASQQRAASSLLEDSVVRTVVSSGNDALNLLFEAASQREGGDERSTATFRGRESITNGTQASLYSAQPLSTSSYPSRLTSAPPDVLRIWNACRFVKMGWFSAEEAVWLVEQFYKNLSPLSSVLTDFYRNPANHFHLLAQEPMLCSTILCLSSRYNVLPEPGGLSRCYLIHERLWDYCQHTISRIMLGQEKGFKAKTRTLGTIEALLLLTEWHPRALHFPPPNDGWDSDILLIAAHDADQGQPEQETTARGSFLKDVINPAKRSDRMSWMLLGCALSLGHELRVFDEEDADDPRTSLAPDEEQKTEQRWRIRKLLYVYTEQLAARLGCKSISSHNLSRKVGPVASPTSGVYRSSNAWQCFMSAWVELTRLVKSVSEMLFPSPKFTRLLLQNGRYISLIEHFQPLLSAFKEKHLNKSQLGERFYDILCIEYHSARIYACSLGLQVVVERILSEPHLNAESVRRLAADIDSTDYGFIQEVVDGSLEVLQVAINLSASHAILYSPVRIFLRITIASIFLLKGMSLGVVSTKLRTALDILTKVIDILRSGALDDMHLGSRYATLLEMHLARLQKNFTPSTRPPHVATFPQSMEGQGNGNINAAMTSMNPSQQNQETSPRRLEIASDAIEDWLTLPLDSSLMPFVSDDANGLSWLGDGSLDFIWNLDT